MNEEARLNELYQKISDVIIQTLPEKWTKVYLYGEIAEGVRKSYFFYYPENGNSPVYCHDIPELFPVSQEEYDRLWYLSLDYLKELWLEFKKLERSQWTSLTLNFDSTGSFKIDYDYDDLSKVNDHERMIVWEYNYLGLVPQHESDRRYLEHYLKSKKN